LKEELSHGEHENLGRMRVLDARPINLDGFSVPDPELGLVAMRSPFDPEPSLVIEDGRIVELDGKARADFDLIDEFIANRGIDLTTADEVMAMQDTLLARMVVDINVARSEVVRLIGGATPAKLARVVALLNAAELQVAMGKMRARRTPSNQAHVTNQLDDPLLLAADAASAVAYGFRELETTTVVLSDAPSNAVSLLIGSQVGVPGAMAQCSIEEALELRLGLRGLTSYAETVSIYGTEQVFVDGDDTPYSKAILTAAYASRGLKMRISSGGGSEVLMGAAERCSILYLEARCVSLARALGSQGVQNGGLDGVGVVASIPEGMKELVAENLMVMMRDMELCAGNDNLISESDIRRTAHTLPTLLGGADFLFGGFGSTPRYDNCFAISNFNADDMDDYLVLQRDWGIDGGLRTVSAEHLARVRRRAATAVQAVYRDLGLADFDDQRVDAVVVANGSRDLPPGDPKVVAEAAKAIEARQLHVFDIIGSLQRTGFDLEAEAIMQLTRKRLAGDQLQTAAIFDDEFNVLSKITDPNDYTGPATGYTLSAQRRAEIDNIRQARTTEQWTADQEEHRDHIKVTPVGEARPGIDPREVCIGLSPAFGKTVWVSLCGMPIGEVLRQISAGLEEEGCVARFVQVRSTIDVGMIGLCAARLAGSGIGIGLQAKGTALIHRRDLSPLANLELFSVAPLLTPKRYRELGKNAARHAKGMAPVPILTGGTDESISARYHARVVALVALERAASEPGKHPLTVEVTRP
jgi:propanediol dehydratase large subunit